MPNTVSKTISDESLSRIIQIESAGKVRAKASTSSASGLGQFLDATWMAVVKQHRPDLLKDRSKADVLALRFDPNIAVEMLARFTEDNAAALGAGWTDGDLYLAHFAGVGTAKKLLRADASTPVSAIMSAAAIKANASILRGKTAGQVRAWASSKMAKAGGHNWVAAYYVPDQTAPIDPGPPPHEVNVQPPSATYRAQIETAQRCLDKLGYHEVGEIDGLMGGKTKGAITAFLNDRGLKDVGGLEGIDEALSKAIAEGWSRPIAPSRANATAHDIAPKVEAVRQSLLQRFWAKVTGTGAAAGTVVMGAASQFGAVNDQISPIKEFFSSVPGWAWFALAALAAVLLYISSNRSAEATTTDYNTGRIN